MSTLLPAHTLPALLTQRSLSADSAHALASWQSRFHRPRSLTASWRREISIRDVALLCRHSSWDRASLTGLNPGSPQTETHRNAYNLDRMPQMVSVSLAVVGLVGPTVADTATQLAAVEALASGALEGNFRDTRFKSKVTHPNRPRPPPAAPSRPPLLTTQQSLRHATIPSLL